MRLTLEPQKDFDTVERKLDRIFRRIEKNIFPQSDLSAVDNLLKRLPAMPRYFLPVLYKPFNVLPFRQPEVFHV